MNEICRFCLIKSKGIMCSLFEENNVLENLKMNMNIEISSNTSLPRNICNNCAQKINEIELFHTKIKCSEELLAKCIETNTLQEFYKERCTTYDYEPEKLKNDDCVMSSMNHNLNLTKSVFVVNGINKINFMSDDVKIESNDRIKTEPLNHIPNDNYSKSMENATFNEKNVTFDALENSDMNLNNLDERCDSSDDNQTLSTIKLEKTNKSIKTNEEKKSKANKNESNMFIEFTGNNYPNSQNCLMCSNHYLSHTDLVKHYNNDHLNKCQKMKLMYSKINVDGIVTFKCNICKKDCNRRMDITKHVNTHNTERPLFCKLCGRTYKTVSEILRHGRVHSGVRYLCSYKCGYSTAHSGTLKAHELKHREGYKYKCEECGKGFHVKTWYEQHRNIHNGLKPFVCDICGAAFPMDRYLTSHRSSKHPQTLDVKRYVCMHCGLKCDCVNSLDIHLQEHGIKNKQKGFLCDTCGKVLCTTEQVKYHHRMHAGVKLFSCRICNKTFSKKFNLQLHERSHSGENKHTCAQCGKRYSQKSTLTRHINNVHEASATPVTE